jgi:Tol biopolymer transport system component
MKIHSFTAPASASAILLAGLGVFTAFSAAAPKYSDWSEAVNLGPVVNSPANDFAPHISRNGLSLYFASTRDGGFGGEDLWVSQRASRDDPWGPPVNLGPVINTGALERSPALSRDGHFLFFATSRPGGFGGLDIWVSWRAHTHNDFAWQPPMNLGAAVNSGFTDAGPSYFENDDVGIPLLYLASNRPGGPGGLDLYVSKMTLNGSFGPPLLIGELSGPANDGTPSLRFDGLEVFFFSNRPGGQGNADVWVASRETAQNSWSEPINPGPAINSASNESFPMLSSGRETLYFNSNRPGGFGGDDLYVSTRSKRTGPR